MSLLKHAKYLLRVHNISLRKRLGQNFMIDERYLQLLCMYAELKDSDTVLEIGAGLGFLTQMLAQSAKRVIAVEFDPHLMKVLQGELAESHNVDLIEGDILKVSTQPFTRVVANPPFSLSSPILFWLLKQSFKEAVLTLQREYAMRLNAIVGSKAYSRLTVSVYRHANAELLDIVPKEAFYPSPRIDAQIVKLVPHKKPPFHIENDVFFDNIVRLLFTQRNRRVQTAIRQLFQGHSLRGCDTIGRNGSTSILNKRVRELTPQEFEVLATELAT